MFLILMGGCISASTETDVSLGVLDVLTYNIHALPSAVTGDDTRGRVTEIAPLLKDFDCIGIQEDWINEYHPILVEGSGLPYVDRFDVPLDDEKVYGSGLSFLGKHVIRQSQHIYYDSCFGLLENSSDCFASKGVQFLEIEMNGARVHLYNTHLEAGNGLEDQDVRAQQIETILQEIDSNSPDAPVILMGDFNLEPDKEEEDLLLARIRDEGGFQLTCTQVNCLEPNHIDQIYIRSGIDIELEVLLWERKEDFVDMQGIPLSDHPAIMTRIQWSKK
ncbi:MAG: hypothetical protein CL916_00425 [Deltaproteobacteria bacterium]|nr:hypothetical protein [Deltaproteobacteria bacterium]